MKKLVFFAIMLLSIVTSVSAQRANQKWYRHAIGIRVENEDLIGISYDRFLSNQTAGELFLMSDLSSGAEITGLYKYVKSLPDVPASVRWYAGCGVHIGQWEQTDIVFGVDGVLGIGYTFDQIPLNLTIDWHPIINVVTSNKNEAFIPIKFGLSARYIIE